MGEVQGQMESISAGTGQATCLFWHYCRPRRCGVESMEQWRGEAAGSPGAWGRSSGSSNHPRSSTEHYVVRSSLEECSRSRALRLADLPAPEPAASSVTPRRWLDGAGAKQNSRRVPKESRSEEVRSAIGSVLDCRMQMCAERR